jgi:hypothetical protein
MKYYTGYQYLTTTGNIFNCICVRGEHAVMQSEEDPDVVIRVDGKGGSPYSDYLILGEVPATGIPNYIAGDRLGNFLVVQNDDLHLELVDMTTYERHPVEFRNNTRLYTYLLQLGVVG